MAEENKKNEGDVACAGCKGWYAPGTMVSHPQKGLLCEECQALIVADEEMPLDKKGLVGKCCGNCRFNALADVPLELQCWRYPPTPLIRLESGRVGEVAQTESKTINIRPAVAPDDFCGEHQPS